MITQKEQDLLDDVFYPISISTVKSGYAINKKGLIKNRHDKIVKPYLNRQGYHIVKLAGINKRAILSIHRIVAITFISKIDGKDIVNHKDFNRINNHIDNLEWVTQSENVLHSLNRTSKGKKSIIEKSEIIKYLYRNGFFYKDIKKIIPISGPYFYKIVNN